MSATFVRRVFVPFAAGYFLSQLLRSVNAVVARDLIEDLSLDAWTVGFLTSAYFLAFAAAQLPVGVALDRYGPRRTESALLLFAAIGALVFARAETVPGLVAARALIGLGVSACLMASFHAFVLWAPGARLPFLNGAVMAAGAMGALTATAPVEWAVGVIGWRSLFLILAGLTVAVGIFLFASAPDASEASKDSLADVIRGVGGVFANRAFWSVAPLSIVHQGSYLAIQSLWAGPWLRDVAGLDRSAVASHLLTLAIGMALGYLGLGYLTERLARNGVSPLLVWGVAAVVFQLTQGALVLGLVTHARALWFAFGLFGASGMLGYAILTRRFPVAMAGRVNSGLNVMVFGAAFAIQSGIGAVIDWFSPGAAFSPEGYRAALGGALALQILGLAWIASTASWRRTV
jgi:predicted MFS family arabinose efflux permease